MNRPLIIAAIGVAAVALAIGLNYSPSIDSEPTEKSTDTTPATPTAPAPDTQATDKAEAAAPKPAAPSATAGRDPSADLAALAPPSFDVVRVNPQGDSVMAGRATPGATVLIMELGKVIGQVKADNRGEWVFVPESPLNPGDRQLTLEMQVAGRPAVKSEEAVVLVVPEKGKDISGRPAETEKQRKPLAMKVPLKDGRPTVVLQKPTADVAAATPPAPDGAATAPAPTTAESQPTTAAKPAPAPREAETTARGVMRAPTSNTAAAPPPPGTASTAGTMSAPPASASTGVAKAPAAAPADMPRVGSETTAMANRAAPAPEAAPDGTAPAPQAAPGGTAPAPQAAPGGAVTAAAERPRPTASGGRKLPPVRPPQQPAGSTIRLTVDTVDYDDDGRLTISGQAETQARVQVYLNNDFVGRAAAGADSRWTLSPERMVAPGLYALRADQVDPGGKVVSRVMFPFARAEPLTQVAQGDFVIVQPGNSLWRIARRTYGAGTRYTVIFEANREQIRDADLIYPGQIFAVPPSN